MKKPSKNNLVLFGLTAVLATMIGLVAISEPLYRMFCGATGYNGTTQGTVAASAPAHLSAKDRIITVRFDGNVDPSLPWDFKAETPSIRVHIGETATVKFRAHNNGTRTMTGTATHNVQPDKAGLYFTKLQCFCFTKQTLKPGQSDEMPVQFYIDPSIADDRTEDDVNTITLSYTFYSVKNQGKNTLSQAGAPTSDDHSNP